jgi:hypothetical protein
VGRLPELSQAGDTVSIPGTVTMRPVEKVFLSVWFGLLLIILAICLVQAILLASRFAFFSINVLDDLAAMGFMLGWGGLVAVFGIVVLVILRLIYKGQRKKLIEFCVNKRGQSNFVFEYNK